MAEKKASDNQVQYLSYLVRFWREEGEAEWHSQVDHIQSGRRVSFDSIEQLFDFLRQQTLEQPLGQQGDEG